MVTLPSGEYATARAAAAAGTIMVCRCPSQLPDSVVKNKNAELNLDGLFFFSDTVVLGNFKRRGGCLDRARDPLLPAIRKCTGTFTTTPAATQHEYISS
jgi:hypothetical protein